MLAESLHYLLTPAAWSGRRHQAVVDSVALWARGRRVRSHWAEHEARTRAVIEAAAAAIPGRGSVWVLGSGLLRDVPLEALAAGFERVVLVDLVHLASVRYGLWRSGLRNITLVEHDLAGCDDSGAIVADPCAPLVERLGAPDWVVSANLLSQIGVGLAARLPDAAGLPGDGPDPRVRLVLNAHLDALARLSCPVCLITDTTATTRNRAQAVIDRHDLMHGLVLPVPAQRWSWPVVPFSETGGRETVSHDVAAYPDWRRAWPTRCATP